LADEPTGNLDSRQSGRVTQLLRNLASDSNQTIVMVTHDANVARSAFRLLMFRDGNIERDISQDEFAANAQAFQVGSSSSSGTFPKVPSTPPSDPAILSEGNR